MEKPKCDIPNCHRKALKTSIFCGPHEYAGEPSKYPIAGYAPGNYYCTCMDCKQQFQGDKRAIRCEPCATKEPVNEVSEKEENQDDLWVSLVEEWNWASLDDYAGKDVIGYLKSKFTIKRK